MSPWFSGICAICTVFAAMGFWNLVRQGPSLNTIFNFLLFAPIAIWGVIRKLRELREDREAGDRPAEPVRSRSPEKDDRPLPDPISPVLRVREQGEGDEKGGRRITLLLKDRLSFSSRLPMRVWLLGTLLWLGFYLVFQPWARAGGVRDIACADAFGSGYSSSGDSVGAGSRRAGRT